MNLNTIGHGLGATSVSLNLKPDGMQEKGKGFPTKNHSNRYDVVVIIHSVLSG
jgi:hypothetical protein